MLLIVSHVSVRCYWYLSVTANRHLETYAPDTGAGMSLIHFLFSYWSHSVIEHWNKDIIFQQHIYNTDTDCFLQPPYQCHAR